jgi:hypothetical protein
VPLGLAALIIEVPVVILAVLVLASQRQAGGGVRRPWPASGYPRLRGGDHLPTRETVEAYVSALGADPTAWRSRWEEAQRREQDRREGGSLSPGALPDGRAGYISEVFLRARDRWRAGLAPVPLTSNPRRRRRRPVRRLPVDSGQARARPADVAGAGRRARRCPGAHAPGAGRGHAGRGAVDDDAGHRGCGARAGDRDLRGADRAAPGPQPVL